MPSKRTSDKVNVAREPQGLHHSLLLVKGHFKVLTLGSRDFEHSPDLPVVLLVPEHSTPISILFITQRDRQS